LTLGEIGRPAASAVLALTAAKHEIAAELRRLTRVAERAHRGAGRQASE
jgi:hypothetical protein